jgi:hypothetical protein
MWLYTILAMIGENFEAGQSLCGAVVRCDACCGWLARKNKKMKKCPIPAAARAFFICPDLSSFALTCPLSCLVTCLLATTISLRKGGDRVAVWTKSADDEKACMEIGEQFKGAISECLQSEVPKDALEYHVHNDALQSSKNKNDKAGAKVAKFTL